MRSSSSVGIPPVTAATAATNESLKTAYEGEVLDESDIEHRDYEYDLIDLGYTLLQLLSSDRPRGDGVLPHGGADG